MKPNKTRFLDREKTAATIRRLRKEKGMTQLGLAEALGVSRSLVASWEGGKSLPELGNIKYMSRLFGVPADYILGVSDRRYNIKVPDYFEFDLTKLNNDDIYLLYEFYKFLLSRYEDRNEEGE